ncbi:hypothetical protein [Bacillus sp. ISL-46]|uniref:hypothetical protein n=1 Tax=Bacillus sp. ISL-46 TaxID=2819129 RepID=UPI001BE5A135|nr:hypothetical protein [Bacillus sp. ISL-46]MBT2723061.1 hypothetical protein [Bacillus sp. ISL-46]
MITLLFGFVLLIIGLTIVAVVLDKIEKQFKIQLDQIKKENRELKRRVFDLELRK